MTDDQTVAFQTAQLLDKSENLVRRYDGRRNVQFFCRRRGRFLCSLEFSGKDRADFGIFQYSGKPLRSLLAGSRQIRIVPVRRLFRVPNHKDDWRCRGRRQREQQNRGYDN